MITLWELKGKDGRRYSLFSWRTKMALKHKGLAFESQPVLMSDKAAIAFSGGKTVPVIVADVHERVDPADEHYFRQQFEGFLKCTLEEARARQPKALERLARALEPMQAALKRQPFICGSAPAYADYILFSVLQWARITSPQAIFNNSDVMYGWRERILDLYDGFARNIPTA